MRWRSDLDQRWQHHGLRKIGKCRLAPPNNHNLSLRVDSLVKHGRIAVRPVNHSQVDVIYWKRLYIYIYSRVTVGVWWSIIIVVCLWLIGWRHVVIGDWWSTCRPSIVLTICQSHVTYGLVILTIFIRLCQPLCHSYEVAKVKT